MSTLLTRRLALLSSSKHRPLLARGLRGIERETLRVDQHAHLVTTPHPAALGSALTHPQITTDYSESLLEFITPAEHDIETVLTELDAIHRFAYSKLDNELLWSQSMPCRLPEEEDIPIARYGSSHIGMLKHVYRRGLALRYGKAMQCIAGIHYNYSLSEDVWRLLQSDENAPGSAQDFQSESYIALVRNFQRYSWLLMYLFGASPALDAHFLRGQAHQLDTLSPDTLFLPYATSLRMSDLGYQNHAQAGLMPPYNTLYSYMSNLLRAVRQPYAPYQEIGAYRNGEWIQINTNLLQIENEYYATIRPKRVIRMGERPLEALCTRGVQYIEVRCMDVDPFDPLGINLETSRFLDAFLLFCALDDSALTDVAEEQENTGNFSRTVKEGRRPGLHLQHHGKEVALKDWGLALLDRIAEAAVVLDADRPDAVHAASLAAQRAKLLSAELTPSARVLATLRANGGSFTEFALRQSQAHAADFRARPPTPQEVDHFNELARVSVAEQTQLEATQTGDFDAFITQYRAHTPAKLCDEATPLAN
ncbi:MAG: glutamate--cysteine ligase [Herminiimonas sp.]|nr:glutamate--cysteine ligase [Herminiimonas sp.]